MGSRVLVPIQHLAASSSVPMLFCPPPGPGLRAKVLVLHSFLLGSLGCVGGRTIARSLCCTGRSTKGTVIPDVFQHFSWARSTRALSRIQLVFPKTGRLTDISSLYLCLETCVSSLIYISLILPPHRLCVSLLHFSGIVSAARDILSAQKVPSYMRHPGQAEVGY